jgi:hypothetical protein
MGGVQLKAAEGSGIEKWRKINSKKPLTTADCNIKCKNNIYIFLTVCGHER